jgi:protein-disulfide isomerase
MEDSSPNYVAHTHWYTRPGPLAAAIFFVLLGGFYVGLVFRSFSEAAKQSGAQFTRNPSPETAGVSSADSRGVSNDDPSLGPVDAPVTIVEFGDFQCPYCREVFPTVRRLMNLYDGKIRFVFRDYPISDGHPLAQTAAEAGMCAWEQGSNQFWSLHDRLFSNQDAISEDRIQSWAALSGADREALSTCLQSGRYHQEVLDDLADGVKLGVRGTPTFFVNGEKFEGVLSEEVFRDVIDRHIQEAER